MWNEETINRLMLMIADGDGPKKIADSLSCSRNAVIGKMRRLGIKFHYGSRDKKRQKSAPKPTPKRKSTFNFRSATPKEPSKPIAVMATGADDVARCSILELSDRRCKWPIGTPGTPEFGFCGVDKSPNSGSPYCPEHTSRSYA